MIKRKGIDLPPCTLPGYRDLKSWDGRIVGYVCVECGRLNTAPHLPDCSWSKEAK